MTKKILISLAPLLVVAAFAITATAAQAEPHWYRCEAKAAGGFHDPDCTETAGTKLFAQTRLPFTSEKFPIATYGILDLSNTTLGTITCHVVDEGNIWNTTLAAAGKDEVTLFINSSCVSSPSCPGITVTGLRKGSPLSETNAWPTHLIPGPPIRDAIEEIEIKVVCPGVVETVFAGTLTPKVVNGSPSYIEFDAPGSGHLTSTLVGEGVPSGKDFVAEQATGDNIDVLNP
jgi:hypothetical protein